MGHTRLESASPKRRYKTGHRVVAIFAINRLQANFERRHPESVPLIVILRVVCVTFVTMTTVYQLNCDLVVMSHITLLYHKTPLSIRLFFFLFIVSRV